MVQKIRWETLGYLAGREALVFAVLVVTTFGGLGSQRASAASPAVTGVAAAPRLPKPADPVEAVFAFGDDLDAVNYAISFPPDQRDNSRLVTACQAVFADQPTFQAAMQSAGKAAGIAQSLLAAAEPTVELCFDPLSADETTQGRAADGFARYHDRAFDFADAVGK